MTQTPETTATPPAAPPPPARRTRRRLVIAYAAIVLIVAAASGGIAALLVNIAQHKQEAKNPFLKLVNVSEDTVDPAPWGMNWPREYDGYKRTIEPSKTSFGGSETDPAQKAAQHPWLPRMFAGYAFALDYRDRRGHANMLFDQEKTRRVTERPQTGSCLHCHASVMPLYRKLGEGDVMRGFQFTSAMTWREAHDRLVEIGSMNPVAGGAGQEFKRVAGGHPVSCVDCHDPNTMNLRVTRPGFILGIKAFKKHQGVADYDPNRDATRQEMRSYVCAQCHVEYYCGPKTPLFFPWNNGLKVEQMEAYYDSYKFPDGSRFSDWTHAETGAEVLKAQHPEFELWSQGIHARSGVACADCHMPYTRQGAMKISDHHVRSPLLNISRSCQVCHRYEDAEIKARVDTIQKRHFDLTQRAGGVLVNMIDAIGQAKTAGATPEQLAPIRELHRKAQWRLDFIAAENSMGFHAPQEAARILAESIDYSRQAELAARTLRIPATQPK